MIVKYKDYQLEHDIKIYSKQHFYDRIHSMCNALMNTVEELERLDKDNPVLRDPWLIDYLAVQRQHIKILEAKNKRLQKSRILEKEKKAKREQALSKLTPEEIKALKL